MAKLITDDVAALTCMGHGSWISVTCPPRVPSRERHAAFRMITTAFEFRGLKIEKLAAAVTGRNAPGSSCRARVHS